MTRTLMLNTQVAVVLSLSVVAVTNTGPQVVTLPLANLTPILFALASCWQSADRLTTTAAKVAARLVFTVAGMTVKPLLKTLSKTLLKTMPKIQLTLFPAFSWGIG